MENEFGIKCPNLKNLLVERDTMRPDQFMSQQRIQVGLNQLINRVRLALAEEIQREEDVCYKYPRPEYSEKDVKVIQRILEQNNYTVTCRQARGLPGDTEYELTVKIPTR